MVFHRGQVKKTTTTTNKQTKRNESKMLIAVSMTPRHHFQIGVVLKETVSR